MRNLIHIPTVHDLSDIPPGIANTVSLSRRLLRQFWADRVWKTIEEGIENYNLAGMRIYSESVSANDISSLNGRFSDQVELAKGLLKSESRQARLIGKLIQGGAILEKTESDLRYKTMGWIAHRGAEGKIFAGPKLYDLSKKLRDKYIAKSIDGTLLDGETGILILGAGHNIQSFLAGDIQIKSLTPELPSVIERYFAAIGVSTQEGQGKGPERR